MVEQESEEEENEIVHILKPLAPSTPVRKKSAAAELFLTPDGAAASGAPPAAAKSPVAVGSDVSSIARMAESTVSDLELHYLQFGATKLQIHIIPCFFQLQLLIHHRFFRFQGH